jgi:Arc/MetJ-type ribon-helix-helix transcriptional regulator
MMMEMQEIRIPKVLYDDIKARLKDTGFTSVSDYASYVLAEVISNMDQDDKGETISDSDQEKIKERLRALGYLD